MRFAEAESAIVAHLYDGISLEGELDKLNNLFSQALHARVLHFSCHGEFTPINPLGSFLAISANERLTAQEIANQMRLRCELVVLSACESGLSSIRRGDEMLGLLRAFFYAGAQALLVTLWRVDERATLLLMQHFYRMTLAGKDFATALKEAQLYLMHLNGTEFKKEFLPIANLVAEELATWPAEDELPFAEPRDWAGFVLFQQGKPS